MFRDDALKRPQTISIVLTPVVAVGAYFGAAYSPMIGYTLAILTMLLIGFASRSVWPTRKQSENPIVFALFWGLILGLVVPMLLSILMTEGIAGIWDMVVA